MDSGEKLVKREEAEGEDGKPGRTVRKPLSTQGGGGSNGIRRHALGKSELEWVFRAGSICTETGNDQILSSSFIGPWS